MNLMAGILVKMLNGQNMTMIKILKIINDY